MKKTTLATSVLLAALLLAFPASAGWPYGGYASAGATRLGGSIGNVRNSPDTVQYLYCGVTATATSFSVFCAARDSLGTSAQCRTTDPVLMDAILAMPEDAWFYLAIDPATGTCTELQLWPASMTEPKRP